MRPRRLLPFLAVGAILLGADQLVQWTVLRDGRLAGRWVIPFDPPLFSTWQLRRAADVAAIVAGDQELDASSILDPELGWCPRPEQDLGLYQYDWSGSRLQLGPLARTKVPGVRRVVTVGCSFTQGAEVQGYETWSALLDARRADLEVANLGQGGYGSDQAYLRFLRDGRKLEPDEVWLGFLPESTLRITALYPPAHNHWSTMLAFKPRFVLGSEEDETTLVPSPARDHAALHALLTDQALFFAAMTPADLWVARTPAAYAPRGSSWTHWFATTRLFVTWLESGDRDPAPYLRDRDGEVYRLLRALVLRLAREAREAGARFRLVVLPCLPDLRQARGPEGAYWLGLVEDLAARGIECIDTTPALLAARADDQPRFWMPGTHYSPEANRVVADELERVLGP
jgi:hypothetical protein